VWTAIIITPITAPFAFCFRRAGPANMARAIIDQEHVDAQNKRINALTTRLHEQWIAPESPSASQSKDGYVLKEVWGKGDTVPDTQVFKLDFSRSSKHQALSRDPKQKITIMRNKGPRTRPSSRPTSRPTSRPASRPTSRPASRPTSPPLSAWDQGKQSLDPKDAQASDKVAQRSNFNLPDLNVNTKANAEAKSMSSGRNAPLETPFPDSVDHKSTIDPTSIIDPKAGGIIASVGLDDDSVGKSSIFNHKPSAFSPQKLQPLHHIPSKSPQALIVDSKENDGVRSIRGRRNAGVYVHASPLHSPEVSKSIGPIDFKASGSAESSRLSSAKDSTAKSFVISAKKYEASTVLSLASKTGVRSRSKKREAGMGTVAMQVCVCVCVFVCVCVL
jgi:hypothetical protein